MGGLFLGTAIFWDVEYPGQNSPIFLFEKKEDFFRVYIISSMSLI